MKVILYTTHCPRCNVLAAKLQEKEIEYQEVTDVKKMLEMGITTAPKLEVEGNPLMDFKEAVEWVRKFGGR